MSRHDKTLRRVLRGESDQAVRFDDLRSLLRRLGFDERQRGGSHCIFTRQDVVEILNLQPRADGSAKPYQLRQVRKLLVKYSLARGDGDTDDG